MEKKDDKHERGKSPKKKYNLRNRRINPKNTRRKFEASDDSDSDSDYNPEEPVGGSDSDSEGDDCDDMDVREYQKFIQKLFPSRAGRDRLKQLDKLDKLIAKEKESRDDKELDKELMKMDKILAKEERKKASSKRSRRRKRRSRNKRATNKKITPEHPMVKEEDEEEDDDKEEDKSTGPTDLDYILHDDDEEEMDEDEIKDMLRQNMKFNIIFTVGDPKAGREEDDDLDSDSSSDGDGDGENEHGKGVSSLDEDGEGATFEKGTAIEVKMKEWDKYYPGKITKVIKKDKVFDVKLDDDSFELVKGVRAKYLRRVVKDQEYDAVLEELRALSDLKKSKGKEAFLKKFDQLVAVKEKMDKEKKKELDSKQSRRNVRKLRLLLKEKDVMNDFKYFKKMLVEDQKKVLEELRVVNRCSNREKPYRLSLLESKIPPEFKASALRKINTLSYMDPGSGEYYKIKQWVDTFMRIPFGVNKRLSIRMDDGKEKCHEFMENAKKTLDDAVYGLEDAKMQIMQYVGQIISNPASVGSAIAIQGPMGTGKTTLIKEGISKILQRPFAFLALGGATDSSFLEGHSYTYEGSMWGKIVDIVIQSKCMNPVIYFDELDKVSDTPKGEEIIGILTHLTDAAQNGQYHDKYFSNIDFDLSKALFIFSYNDESKISPILRDRMYRITTKGYDTKNKTTIAKGYLIPKIEKNINFNSGEILISDEVIEHIISTLTDKEKGVRNLKRCLEIIYTKLNLHRLMKPDSKLFDTGLSLEVTFPFTVTKEIVNKFVKKSDTNSIPDGMYM